LQKYDIIEEKMKFYFKLIKYHLRIEQAAITPTFIWTKAKLLVLRRDVGHANLPNDILL
jgi:hypothetical protein